MPLTYVDSYEINHNENYYLNMIYILLWEFLPVSNTFFAFLLKVENCCFFGWYWWFLFYTNTFKNLLTASLLIIYASPTIASPPSMSVHQLEVVFFYNRMYLNPTLGTHPLNYANRCKGQGHWHREGDLLQRYPEMSTIEFSEDHKAFSMERSLAFRPPVVKLSRS